MIECHIGRCENHICHTFGDTEGPLCSLETCVKSTDEVIAMMKAQREVPVYDFIPEGEATFLREFLTMSAVIFAMLLVITLLTWWLA